MRHPRTDSRCQKELEAVPIVLTSVQVTLSQTDPRLSISEQISSLLRTVQPRHQKELLGSLCRLVQTSRTEIILRYFLNNAQGLHHHKVLGQPDLYPVQQKLHMNQQLGLLNHELLQSPKLAHLGAGRCSGSHTVITRWPPFTSLQPG